VQILPLTDQVLMMTKLKLLLYRQSDQGGGSLCHLPVYYPK